MTQLHNSILVRLVAKEGRETDVAAFLASALPLVNDERETLTWYAMRFDRSTFGIFDTFADEEGRQAHLRGPVAIALMAHADDLLVAPPEILLGDILATK